MTPCMDGRLQALALTLLCTHCLSHSVPLATIFHAVRALACVFTETSSAAHLAFLWFVFSFKVKLKYHLISQTVLYTPPPDNLLVFFTFYGSLHIMLWRYLILYKCIDIPTLHPGSRIFPWKQETAYPMKERMNKWVFCPSLNCLS